MPKSIDDALTDARVILSDTAGDRYTDADLISDLNSAISMTKMIRPDAFILGSFARDLLSELCLLSCRQCRTER
jgi:hypothetical protein